MRNSLIIVTLLIITRGAFAQPHIWPGEMTAPGQEAPTDSSGLKFGLVQDLYQRNLSSTNGMEWQFNDSSNYLEQNARYEASYDDIVDYNNAINHHFVDLSGSYTRKAWPFAFNSLGLEWNPTIALNNTRDAGDFQGTIDIGPFVSISQFIVPMKLGGGIATKAWNTESEGDIKAISVDNTNFDPGFFLKAEVGNEQEPAFGLPLYMSGKVFARSIGKTDLIGGIASALFCHAMPSNDSLFAFFADSVINGANILLGEGANGKTRFASLPGRLEHSYQIKAGIKAKARAHIIPGIIYGYKSYSKSYWDESLLTDVKNRKNMFQILAHTDSTFLFEYKGGIVFEWENEDWLFDREINSVDEAIINTNDYKGYRADMSHILSKNFPNGMGVEYEFGISRYSKTYSDSEYVNNVLYKGDNDFDQINQYHNGHVVVLSHAKCSVDVFGGGSSNLSHWLKAKRSGANVMDRFYRAGIHVGFYPSDKFSFDETFFAVAENSEYEHPEVHRTPFDPPSYQRKFPSRFKFRWNISDKARLSLNWDLIIDDNGYWDGKEYYDSLPESFEEKYRRQNKTLEQNIDIMLSLSPLQQFSFDMGTEFEDVYLQEWEPVADKWLVNPLGRGYLFAPYLNAGVIGKKHRFQLQSMNKIHFDINEEKDSQTGSRDFSFDYFLELGMQFKMVL
ncbi:MAG: hypothetical protein GF401_16965 [Chitinivibrionales bacterium]|nr:hypothetical protein [Chitinivibrionales bacterium]